MAHPVPNFLIGRRALLAGASAFFAAPALADLGPRLFTGTVAKFDRAKAGKPLPTLEFLDAQDRPALFSDFKDRVLLVNFWATWCAPCVKEMPSLDRLQGLVGKDKLIVLPLSLDGPSRDKVVPFYEQQALINLGIFFDKGRKIMQATGTTVLPTTILADRQGRELGRLEGEADWDQPEAVALINAAVGTSG
ncbi:MAG: TlpA family protein disulfide reductase [Enhydrobacter sp.]|nr:MAG: TlpA family protein disulfide reductase [Enhydrobacter sp.]